MLVLVTRAGILHLQAVLQILLREGDIVSHRLGQVANGGGIGEQDLIGLLTEAPQDGSHLRVVTMLLQELSAVVDRRRDSFQPLHIVGMNQVCFVLARPDLVQDFVDVRVIGCCQREQTSASCPPESRQRRRFAPRARTEFSLAFPLLCGILILFKLVAYRNH